MKIFITGIAGMIGMHAAKQLKFNGHEVTGIDNFNQYYDVTLKRDRASILEKGWGIKSTYAELRDNATWNHMLEGIDCVLHLAAYANPRHSMEFPQHYIDTNITGTQRLIEECEKHEIENVVYASSSCVMHGQELPWNEHDLPHHQNNPYGWSKRANECQFMHSKIPNTTGLRFFTVYGPYGRPDMALFKFTNHIVQGKPIELYNEGNMVRDFTYVDDIVNGIELVIKNTVNSKPIDEIYNIGCGQKVNLFDFVEHIENNLDRKAIRKLVPAHPADTPATWADTSKIEKLGYKSITPIDKGVESFIQWYKTYYGVN